MPSSNTVESFVQLVEGGKTPEAMVRFYAEHAFISFALIADGLRTY
jgi:hypothetical protein